MGWRDNVERGSYNGVSFSFQADSTQIGRRKQVHEYPLRDDPYVEDLGRSARIYAIDMQIVGDDYFDRRDRLIAELEKKGAGVLVHPYYGTLRVQPFEKATIKHSAKSGGMCTISIKFVEGGENKFPDIAVDTTQKLSGAVDNALFVIVDQFDNLLVVDNFPSHVLESAQEAVNSGLTILRNLNGQAAGIIAPVGKLNQSITDISNNLVELIRSPALLAGDITALVHNVFSQSKTVADAKVNYQFLRDNLLAFEPDDPDTSAKKAGTMVRADKNVRAIVTLFSISAALEVMRSLGELSSGFSVSSNDSSPFSSKDDAIETRDFYLQTVSQQLSRVGDLEYEALKSAQYRWQEHVSAHGQTLSRVGYIYPQTSLPIFVVAHQLYGSIDLVDDLIRRNNIRHPGFVGVNQPLEYLQSGGG